MEDSQPDTTTIPSHPPAAATSPPPKPTEPRGPSSHLQQLQSLLLKRLTYTAKSTDRTLLRLSKLLSTPSGTDVLLCTTSYTLTLLHALLSRLLAHRTPASQATKAHLPFSSGPPHTTLLANLARSSKVLAETIADYRIFVRLWGAVGLYTWARATYVDALPAAASVQEKTLRGITWCAIATCVAFQVLENGAYLASKRVLAGAKWSGDAGTVRQNQWWAWSSRFWAAYVGCELLRLGVERYEWEDRGLDVGEGEEKEGKMRREEVKKLEKLDRRRWWRDLASNVAYAPMTIHWSLEQGLLSDWAVGACGMVAGGALLADAWRRTA